MDTTYDAAIGKNARSKTRIIHILSEVWGTPRSTTGIFLSFLTTSHSRGELETILVRNNDLSFKVHEDDPKLLRLASSWGKSRIHRPRLDPHTPHFHLYLCISICDRCLNIQPTCVAVHTEIH
jgi:hypothetical protein